MNAERFRGLKVDYQLELGDLLDRQIDRLCTVENPSSIHAHLPVHICEALPITEHATGSRKLAKLVDGGESLLCRERNDSIAASVKIGVGSDQECPYSSAHDGCARFIHAIISAGVRDDYPL